MRRLSDWYIFRWICRAGNSCTWLLGTILLGLAPRPILMGTHSSLVLCPVFCGLRLSGMFWRRYYVMCIFDTLYYLKLSWAFFLLTGGGLVGHYLVLASFGVVVETCGKFVCLSYHVITKYFVESCSDAQVTWLCSLCGHANSIFLCVPN